MTATRATYHRGNLPADLKQVVEEIVLERGITGVTMAEAARRTGVSPAAPYRHFTSLDELLTATASACYERFEARRAAVVQAHASMTPQEQLDIVVRDFFDFIDEDRAAYLLIFESGLGTRSPALWPAARRDYDLLLRLLARTVGAPKEECRELTFAFGGLVLGMAKVHLENFSTVSTLDEGAELAVQGVKLLIAGARVKLGKM